MFQGSRTNAGLCWQEGGFLPRLREVGDVFVYQNKLYNIFHGLPGFSDFPSDTEFDPGLPVSGGTPSRRVRRRATAVPAPRARRRRLVRGRAPRLRLRAALFSEKLWCSSIRRWCRLQGCVLACSSTGASSALASSLKRTLAGMLGRMRKRPCMKTAMLLLTLGLMRVTQMGRRKFGHAHCVPDVQLHQPSQHRGRGPRHDDEPKSGRNRVPQEVSRVPLRAVRRRGPRHLRSPRATASHTQVPALCQVVNRARA